MSRDHVVETTDAEFDGAEHGSAARFDEEAISKPNVVVVVRSLDARAKSGRQSQNTRSRRSRVRQEDSNCSRGELSRASFLLTGVFLSRVVVLI